MQPPAEEQQNSTQGPLEGFTWPAVRALVLGGTGMIGSHTVRALLRRGARVRVLARPSSTTRTLEGLLVERAPGDLGDLDSVRAALPGCDLLFHCAAPYPRSHFHRLRQVEGARRSMAGLLAVAREFVPHELLDPVPGHLAARAVERAEGAANVIRMQPERADELARAVTNPALLQAALAGRLNASLHPPLAETMHVPGLKRFIYTSSLTTIGRPAGRDRFESWPRLADERDRSDLTHASSPYFAMKAEMEAEATRAAVEGMPVLIGNPSLCVDAYDPTPTTGKLLVAVARRRMPVYLPGVMNVVATRDVGEALVNAAVLGRTGQRYILGRREHDSGRFPEVGRAYGRGAAAACPGADPAGRGDRFRQRTVEPALAPRLGRVAGERGPDDEAQPGFRLQSGALGATDAAHPHRHRGGRCSGLVGGERIPVNTSRRRSTGSRTALWRPRLAVAPGQEPVRKLAAPGSPGLRNSSSLARSGARRGSPQD